MRYTLYQNKLPDIQLCDHMIAKMCFTSDLSLTFESNCQVSQDLVPRVLLANKVILSKYHNQKLKWINESTSKCSGVGGSLSLNGPFHQASSHVRTEGTKTTPS